MSQQNGPLTRLRRRLSEFSSTLLFAVAIVPAISLAACGCREGFVAWMKLRSMKNTHAKWRAKQAPRTLTSIFLRVRKAGFCWIA